MQDALFSFTDKHVREPRKYTSKPCTYRRRRETARITCSAQTAPQRPDVGVYLMTSRGGARTKQHQKQS